MKTHADYPNSFSRDSYLFDEVMSLIKKYSVSNVIETGTFEGETSRALSVMAPNVLTIESNFEYYRKATDNLKDIANVVSVIGDSPELLKLFIPQMRGRLLLFLDAHWGPVWPLEQELASIRLAVQKPVIVIHDFKVDGRPDIGFDSYGGLECSWPQFGGLVENIYGVGCYTRRHPEKVSGAMRGTLIVEPL
jgi:hypothetical protein